MSGFFRSLFCFPHNRPVRGRKVLLVHQHLDFNDLFLRTGAVCHSHHCLIIAADNLLTGGFPAHFVIHNTVARHVDAHISGRLVRAFAVYLFKNGTQYRKNLHVTIVVYRGFPVSFQTEGVNHVDII